MKFVNLINLIMLGSLAFCCRDDNKPLTTASDLTGTWEAISVEFTNRSIQAQTAEQISRGVSATLTVQSNSRYLSEIRDDQGRIETDAGVMIVRGESLVFNSDDDADDRIFKFEYSGNLLTLNRNDVAFDFNDDGFDEPAWVEMVLRRR